MKMIEDLPANSRATFTILRCARSWPITAQRKAALVARLRRGDPEAERRS
jgi:hypothetical protein